MKLYKSYSNITGGKVKSTDFTENPASISAEMRSKSHRRNLGASYITTSQYLMLVCMNAVKSRSAWNSI